MNKCMPRNKIPLFQVHMDEIDCPVVETTNA